jgi:CBS domain-containing protein
MIGKASDIISKDFRKISTEDTLSRALSQFDDTHHVLFVFEDEEYKGILAQKNLNRTGLIPDEVKVSSLIEYAPKVDKDATLSECARLMIENDVMTLPVIEDEEMVGVVEDKKILEAAALTELGDRKINRYMTQEVITTEPDARISEVMAEFRNQQISRMPVLENGKIAGIITIHDIRGQIQVKERQMLGYLMDEKASELDKPVKDIMTKVIIRANIDETVDAVIKKMLKNDINSVIIFDQDMLLLKGIVTRKDLLEPIAELESGMEPPVINITSKIEDLDRIRIGDVITEFNDRYKESLKDSFFNVYVQEHKETHRENRLIFVRINLHTPAGRFSATGEGWSEELAVKNTLEKIDKQIEKKLDLRNMTQEKIFPDADNTMLNGISSDEAEKMGLDR